MPKGSGAEYPMGTMPFLVLIAGFAFALYALIYGLGTLTLVSYVSITAIVTGAVGILWWLVAMKSPAWRMGTQASLVLVVLALFTFFAVAPKVDSALPFQIMPLEVVNGTVVGGSINVTVILAILVVAVVSAFLSGRKIRDLL